MKEIYKYQLNLVRNQNFKSVDLKTLENVKSFLIDDVHLANESEEVVILIALDIQLNMTGFFEVSRGTIEQTICSPKDVFKRLLLANCSGFMIAHNHPSGNLQPSLEDKENSKTLNVLSEMMGINMIDYLIVTEDDVLSFKKEKYI